MKRLFVLFLLAPLIAACASVPISTNISRNTLYGLVQSYGIALAGATAYKSLPLCKTGTKFTIENPCAQRSIVVRMQAADRRAIKAIGDATTFMRTYPTLDASNVVAAAQSAISSYNALVTDAKVGAP